MSADRPEVVDSPLIEDFLDCDQLVSDSDSDACSSSSGSSSSPSSRSASPRRTFKRLHIHVDMTSATQYLTPSAHHSESIQLDGLPICSSGPQTIGFSSPDLDPYSAVSGVSSFNYPAAADPSLLTPVSSAGSPPLQHRQSAKPMRNYSAPGSQAPTPPNTSKLYFESYPGSSSSQGSSPMTVNPAATEAGAFDMASYMAHSPPVSHHPSSPKSELPPPIDPYLGHYTVSEANNGEVTHQSLQEYHSYGVDVAAPTAYLGHHHQQSVAVGTTHMHHRMPSNGSVGAPVLSQPHPSHYRPPSGQIEDLRDPSMLLGAYPTHGAVSPGRRPPPRKKPSPARKPSRTPKATPHLGSDGSGPFKHEDDNEEELTLNDDAPEDDRYLFQLRKQYLSEKGKGMWEEMKAKYSEKHQGNWEKAALQMKVSRAVARYGVWPEKEIERLKEAFQYYEDKRYQLIIARMKENGGCRAWDWKTSHIEYQLVRLGLEEPSLNEKTGARRRRKTAARQRQASPLHNHNHNHNNNNNNNNNSAAGVMGDWGNSLGLSSHHHPHPHAGYAHQVATAVRQNGGPSSSSSSSYDAFVGAQAQHQQSTLTPSQADDLLNQVFSKVKTERSLSPDDDGSAMEGLAYDDDDAVAGPSSRRPSAAARGLDHQGSERVARGTCQQMLGGAYGAP